MQPLMAASRERIMKLKTVTALLALLAPALCYSQEAELNDPNDSHRLVLESITCQGNENISCDFIRSKLRLHFGEALRDDDVQDAKLRLSALSNFKTVDIRLEKGSERGKAVVVVEVKEASSIATEFVGGVTHSVYVPNQSPIHATYTKATLAGRISNQNLFGYQKIFEFGVTGDYGESSSRQDIPIPNSMTANVTSDTDIRSLSSDAHYVDPNLLGTEKLYLSAWASYESAHNSGKFSYNNIDPSRSTFFPPDGRFKNETQLLQSGLMLGYRLWSFSYVDIDYSYSRYNSSLDQFGTALSTSGSNRVGSATLGWDSEDDPYFVTEGARASATYSYQLTDSPCEPDCNWNWGLAYKQTWSLSARSVISINIGGTPSAMADRLRPLGQDYSTDGLGITYGHKMFGNDEGQLRNRWYVQLGTGPVELRRDGRIGGGADHVTITLGARFEISRFGMINLYASGTRVWPPQTLQQ
jgi:hypothetical protein